MNMYDGEEGTLYILGNGFDCCHRLDTSVKRFLEILKTKDVYNETETAEIVLRRYNVLWGDYESCLADIDLESIVEEHLMQPDYYSDHEYDRDGGIYNMEMYTESLRWAIKESLETMVDDANHKLLHKKPELIDFLKPNDTVLSFNYTSTLERLYNIPNEVQVCHIHGFREKGELLLFGFRDGISEEEYHSKYIDENAIRQILEKIQEIQEDETLSEKDKERELYYWQKCYDEETGGSDFYIDMQHDVVFQFYQLLKKEIQTEKLKKFLANCTRIKRVIVMGHSMSDVDSEYMELIEEILSPFEWRISQYDNCPSQEDINKYSFARKVKFYDLYANFGIHKD